MTKHSEHSTPLTGRLRQGPDALIHEEVLQPQFTYEIEHLLQHYLSIEQAMLVEYRRMGLISAQAMAEIGRLLRSISAEELQARPDHNMSDIAFAIERYVEERLTIPAPGWHMDRSRNDYQACAQLMLAREQILATVEVGLAFGQAVLQAAEKTAEMPMPGYTHYQAAQIITPGFYLAGVNEQVIATLRRLLQVADEINRCPLGSGALAGLEYPWDRERMAELLGFAGPQPLALTGVAARNWVLQIAGELSTFGVTLSRIVTDFIQWGSSEYGFIDLPDSMAGISSAMPQKKNLTILERIRGKTAHLSAYHLDFVLGQRNTPYSNLVEVSKEAGSNLMPMFRTIGLTLHLFTAVLQHIQFRTARMLAACERDYFGGFALANALTRQDSIPYRAAQAIAGLYIVAMMEQNRLPSQVDHQALVAACQQRGYQTSLTEAQVRSAFDVWENLRGKRSAGSTNPDEVRAVLARHAQALHDLQERHVALRAQIDAAQRAVAQELAPPHPRETTAAALMAPPQSAQQGTGVAFGTFGELLQGCLPDSDLDFLVTLPIARYAHALFVSDPQVRELIVVPFHKEKSRRLAARILQHYNLPPGGMLSLTTDLLEGKGMASSSADLVATARAIMACYGFTIPQRLIQQFLSEIEPTDGVMYDGIVAYFHRQGGLCKYLGALPPLTIAGIDEGGMVDTIEFNKIPKPFGHQEKREYARLLFEMEQAIRSADLQAVGQVATRSAEMNQPLRPKARLTAVKALAEAAGALGVAVAHSGTVIGVLLSPASPTYAAQLRQVIASLHTMSEHVMLFRTLSFQKGESERCSTAT